jgi:hypothetical protein
MSLVFAQAMTLWRRRGGEVGQAEERFGEKDGEGVDIARERERE